MKFKYGDRVKVVHDGFYLGIEGKLTEYTDTLNRVVDSELDTSFEVKRSYLVKLENSERWFYEDDLELSILK